MVYAYQFLKLKRRNDLVELSITYYKRSVEFGLECDCPQEYFNIAYKQYGRDTLIEYKETEISVKDQDFVSVFCEDLKAILTDQKKLLLSFSISLPLGIQNSVDQDYKKEYIEPIGHRIYRFLTNCLQSRGSKLQVRDCFLDAMPMDQMLSILSYFDTETLKLVDSYMTSIGPTPDANEVIKIDIWKECKDLELRVRSETMSFETLVYLEEMFMSSFVFKNVVIHYEYIDDSHLNEFFGHFDEIEDRYDEKIVQYPNTEHDVLFMRNVVDKIIVTREKFYKDGENYYSIESESKDGLSKIISDLSLNDPRCLAVFENASIMKNILEYLKCFDLQSLRKVSSDIRKCVDDIKPDPHIDTMQIAFDNLTNVVLQLHISQNSLKNVGHNTIYSGTKEECTINFSRKNTEKKVFGDFQAIILNDVERELRYQKSCLESLILVFRYDDCFPRSSRSLFHKDFVNTDIVDKPPVDYSLLESATVQFLNGFKKMLKSRNQPLKVKSLHMGILTQYEVMEVLPYIDPAPLKLIEISYGYCRMIKENVQMLLEIHELFELDQWKQAEELLTHSFSVSTPIQHLQIFHFSKGDIILETISSEDLLYLKQEFLKSTSLIKFKITLKNSTVNQTVYELMGWPYRMANPLLRNQKDIWFFRMPNISNSVLHIVHNVSHSIIFSRVELSAVPEDLNLI